MTKIQIQAEVLFGLTTASMKDAEEAVSFNELKTDDIRTLKQSNTTPLLFQLKNI